VLFVNEENGTRGATAYASAAKDSAEKHLFAVETTTAVSTARIFARQHARRRRQARRALVPLFAPYGIFELRNGTPAPTSCR